MMNFLAARLKIDGLFLVIVPQTKIKMWKENLEQQCLLNTMVFDVSNDDSRNLQIARYRTGQTKTAPTLSNNSVTLDKAQVVLTCYENIARHRAFFSKLCFKIVTCDEAHRISHSTSVTRRIIQSFNAVHKVLLTSTPITENWCELWGLLSLLNPQEFANEQLFTHMMNQESIEARQFKDMICSVMLRRKKIDIFKDEIPEE